MDKKTLLHTVEWIVALAACGWLVWKMATYDDYAGLWAALRSMDTARVCALLISIALMPVNMSIEAWKWKTLMNGDASLNGENDEMMNWREAHRQVYYSKLAGLITPWRLGEYPARAMLMEGELNPGIPESRNPESVWQKVLSMGAVGSATMTFAIVAIGTIALSLEIENWRLENGQWTMDNYYLLVLAVLCLLLLALFFAPRMLRRWAEVSHRLILVSVGQSMVRLLCWCVQLALVIYALGGLGELGTLGTIGGCAVYYLLVTISPSVPIAEVGVRGAWAIAVFGTMNAALAGVLLWVINTLLPCAGWFFLRKTLKG